MCTCLVPRNIDSLSMGKMWLTACEHRYRALLGEELPHNSATYYTSWYKYMNFLYPAHRYAVARSPVLLAVALVWGQVDIWHRANHVIVLWLCRPQKAPGCFRFARHTALATAFWLVSSSLRSFFSHASCHRRERGNLARDEHLSVESSFLERLKRDVSDGVVVQQRGGGGQ